MAILCIIPIFLAISVTASAFPVALPGCEDQDHCGNVTIPFPFGTKEKCYFNEDFLIRCKNSSDGSSTAFLRKSDFVVTDISLEGQLRIIGDTGYDCYSPTGNTHYVPYNSWTKSVKPMVFSSRANKFVVIGCDSYVSIGGTSITGRKFLTGCLSICFSKDDVVDGACAGMGCCKTSIPDGTWQMNVTISGYANHSLCWDFNRCSYGFVIEESAFNFHPDNLTHLASSVPVVIDWAVANNVTCEEAKMNSTSYFCRSLNSECDYPKGDLGYRCKCKTGFEGNPYLPNHGCQAIDECANPALHNCPGHSKCVNTLESYTCSCNQGYHWNSRNDMKECIIDGQPPQKRTLWPIYSVIGVSGSSAVIIFLTCFLLSKYTQRKEDMLRKEYYKKNGGFLLQEKLSTLSDRETSTIFTEEELRKATNEFDSSQIIGEGGFGTVYKGVLVNNTIVAIKRSKGVDQREVGQFINEVILLSKINDQNVVKLIGCCLETEVPLLVYEFINNGTLLEHLNNREINKPKLSWGIRLRIASEVARVLSYLHSFASPPIIHRDIKSSNILLDENYKAKVADFGMSKFVSVDENQLSTIVQGTLGYLDPEYMLTGILTEKSDVYSFGIVLIELLSGRKVFSADRQTAERFLSNYFLDCRRDDNLLGIIDHNIPLNDEIIKQIKEVAMIAERCMSVKGIDRPYMKEIARQLETLGMRDDPFVFEALEVEWKESGSLLGKGYSKEYSSSDGYSSSDLYPVTITPNSSDLYPVSITTPHRMLLPIDGGR